MSIYALAIALSLLFVLPAHAEDPYAPIRRYGLDNGLQILLAPTGSAKTVEVELRVQAGWGAETRANQGVARLTERAFLRDEGRRGEQSFQHRIREAGGEASGQTGATATSIFASVPSNRGIWVLNEYSTLLANRQLSNECIDRARAELLLELGEPRPLFQAFFEGLLPTPGRGPDFFETEFRVKNPSQPDAEQLRRDVKALKPDQVRAFFSAYYRPSNSVLIAAGPFKQEATLAFIRETFDHLPTLPAIKAAAPDVTPRTEPYFRSRVADRDSRVSLGTKFWNITAEDEIALKVYFEFLAFRLTRRLRNAHGQAYAAEASVWVDDRRFGYALVNFTTPRQHFQENFQYVRDLLQRETQEGDLSDEHVNLAKDVYARYMELIQNDADTMARLAARLHVFQTVYRTDQTPYQMFRKMGPEKFRQQLRGLFHPRKQYLSLEEPPLYFRNESMLIYFLAVLMSIHVCRRRFLRDFEYTTVRYVRKIKYPPLLTAVLAIGFVGVLWIASQASSLLSKVIIHSSVIQSTFLLSQYFLAAVAIFFLVSAALSYLSFIPRKIILTDKQLIVKGISYYSKRIDLFSIRDISVCRPHQLWSHHLWNSRIVLAHWTPWKRGILIRLENGSGYYLGFRDAARVAEEIRAVLRSRNQAPVHDAA